MAVRKVGRLEVAGNSAFRAVFEHLQREKVRNVRKMGVETLEFWPSKTDTVRCLVALLRTERDKKVRKFIVKSLRDITKENAPADAEAWSLVGARWIDRQDSNKILKSLQRERGGK